MRQPPVLRCRPGRPNLRSIRRPPALPARLPYLYVSTIFHTAATDRGDPAIRIALEALAADPTLDARIAARVLDTDMNRQDITGDGVPNHGGPPPSAADGLQTEGRIAFIPARAWAR